MSPSSAPPLSAKEYKTTKILERKLLVKFIVYNNEGLLILYDFFSFICFLVVVHSNRKISNFHKVIWFFKMGKPFKKVKNHWSILLFLKELVYYCSVWHIPKRMSVLKVTCVSSKVYFLQMHIICAYQIDGLTLIVLR